MIRWLKKLWAGWKRVAGVIGRFQTRIILTLFYFVVAGPAWLFTRLAGKDLLDRRTPDGSSYWKEHQSTSEDGLERARHQF